MENEKRIMVNIDNFNNLTPEIITNYYLYGTYYTPQSAEERVRSEQWRSENIIVLEIDAVEFVQSGPGRFANASKIQYVENFLVPTSPLNLEDGTYTKKQLKENYIEQLVISGESVGSAQSIANAMFNYGFQNYNFGSASADYGSRIFTYNSSVLPYLMTRYLLLPTTVQSAICKI